jgi:GT2 family glycosyltransferase
MTGRPAVSVIIPAYNQGRYLASALDSVLGQSFGDFEIIAVDDGSADETPALLAGYGPPLRTIRQANAGLAATRNRGIAEAGGRWLAFLDADDAWRPDFLAVMVRALDAAPEAVAAFAAWQYVDREGRLLPQVVFPFGGDEQRLADQLAWRNSLLPSAAVVARDAAVACGGFDTALAACEDWDLWLRLRPLGRLLLVPQVLLEYRTHGESMSDDPERIERERLKVNAKHLGPLAGEPAGWPAGRRQAAGYTYFTTALAYFRQGRLEQGAARLNQALACWPELAGRDEFFYELGCGRQERGRRGRNPDLAEGERLLRRLIFEGLALPAGRRGRYWGHACLVLARLARQDGRPAASRRYAWLALRFGRPAHKAAALRLLGRLAVGP